MSAGNAVLDQAIHCVHPHHAHAPPLSYGASSAADMGEASGSGFSDEDLLASLTSFGVEGQTERDLATIKAMLTAGIHEIHEGPGHQAGPSGGWAIPSHPYSQWNAYLHSASQPPPNTPTLSKSLELYGGGHGESPGYGYLGHPPPPGSTRRREVSLDKSYISSLYLQQQQQQQQHQHQAASTSHGGGLHPDDDEEGDANGASATDTGMDVDANGDGDVDVDQLESASTLLDLPDNRRPSHPPHTFIRPARRPSVGATSIMEDIAEESSGATTPFPQEQHHHSAVLAPSVVGGGAVRPGFGLTRPTSSSAPSPPSSLATPALPISPTGGNRDRTFVTANGRNTSPPLLGSPPTTRSRSRALATGAARQ